MVNEGREAGSAGLQRAQKACRPFYVLCVICLLTDVY